VRDFAITCHTLNFKKATKINPMQAEEVEQFKTARNKFYPHYKVELGFK